MISTNRMADLFVDVADTLVNDFDLIEFLHTLAVHTSELTGSPAVVSVFETTNTAGAVTMPFDSRFASRSSSMPHSRIRMDTPGPSPVTVAPGVRSTSATAG